MIRAHNHDAQWMGGTLLIARSPAVRESVARVLAAHPRLAVESVDTLEAGERRLATTSPDLVLLHFGVVSQDADVERILRANATRSTAPEVVLLGESGQLERGIRLLKQGASDFLEWPREVRRLSLLAALLATRRGSDAETDDGLGGLIVTPGSAFARVVEQLECVATVHTSVLLQGETGTGKTMLARLLHDRSLQREGPFVEVNCAAVPETLFESELFGHVKGAFTTALTARQGRLATATNGTLFLDEIDTLSPILQAKLLRVLQSGEYEPVGSDLPQKMDNVRVVAASNKPLEDEVRAGRFRVDLFYRLNVVKLAVPPLREQDPEFFTALVYRFVREFAGRARRTISGVSPEALAALRQHDWPGNVRELRNAIERAVAFRPGGMLRLDDLPDEVRVKAELTLPEPTQVVVDPTLADVKGEAEKCRIVAVLRRTRNNRSRAATELGISRNTLYIKLRQYGLLHVMF